MRADRKRFCSDPVRCQDPLPGLRDGPTRVFTEAWEGDDSLKNGLLVLFACAAAAAILVTRILTS